MCDDLKFKPLNLKSSTYTVGTSFFVHHYVLVADSNHSVFDICSPDRGQSSLPGKLIKNYLLHFIWNSMKFKVPLSSYILGKNIIFIVRSQHR